MVFYRRIPTARAGVHAVPDVARHRERRNDPLLVPVTQAPAASAVRVLGGAVQRAPERHALVARRDQRVARVLPVLLGRVGAAAAPERVASRAPRQVRRRARHLSRRALVDGAVLRRGQRLGARRDAPRALREVGVPHRRERVLVLPGQSVLAEVGNARVFLDVHLHPLRAFVFFVSSAHVAVGDVEQESRVLLELAVRVRARVAPAAARKHLAVLPVRAERGRV